MIEEDKIVVFNSDEDLVFTLPDIHEKYIKAGYRFFIDNKGPGKITVVRSEINEEKDKFDILFRKNFNRYLKDKGHKLSSRLTDEEFSDLLTDFGLRTLSRTREMSKSLDDFI